MTDLHSIARALGGKVRGDRVRAPGPGHSPKDDSLSITVRPDGSLSVHSFAGDDWAVSKDYVRKLAKLPDWPRPPASGRFERGPANLPTSADHSATALALWADARDPLGTPVERYLGRRGVDLSEAAGHALRYHPACPFAGKRTPCMVALVRDAVTDEPKGIHRTALTLEGEKVKVDGKDRLALGPIAGGAVKLTPDESVTLCLGIAEGIETALSLQLIPEFGRSPVWSLISAGGISSFPVLPGIEALWVAVDHDQAGNKAACAVGNRWRAEGREAYLVTPKAARADLNDLVKGSRRHA